MQYMVLIIWFFLHKIRFYDHLFIIIIIIVIVIIIMVKEGQSYIKSTVRSNVQ